MRRWALKYGADCARRMKRKTPSGQDVLHLDGVAVTINGEKCTLWRAVDQDGYGLDEIVQIRRNAKAARRLLTRLPHKQGCRPKRGVNDKLGSYAAATRAVMPNVGSRSHKGLDNRAVNSHVLYENGSEQCRAFDLGPDYNASFQRSAPSATPLFQPVHSLCAFQAPSSPQGDRGVNIRDARRRLKNDTMC